MKITFDPGKDAANTAKHGLSLAVASRLNWAKALMWVDSRKANQREFDRYEAYPLNLSRFIEARSFGGIRANL